MATLDKFPQKLIDEHMAWHMNPLGTPGARSATDRGLDFLNFHHNFLLKVFTWFNAQSPAYRSQYDLSPWTAIPTELKTDPATGWNSTYAGYEDRIVTFSPPFIDEDDFGTFIENGIHNNYLHGACAVHYNDPNIGSPMTAPVISTWFYKIHGLVDNWRAAYQGYLFRKAIDRRFMASVKILFGVANDAPGLVIGPDGLPHPVDPFGPVLSSVTRETKQAMIGMAISHLSAGIMDRKLSDSGQKIGESIMQKNLIVR